MSKKKNKSKKTNNGIQNKKEKLIPMEHASDDVKEEKIDNSVAVIDVPKEEKAETGVASNKALVTKKDAKLLKKQERKEEIKQYWFVIRELTSREVKRKYARSFLGILWSVLNPLLHMVVISLVFSTMFQRDIENYPVYYLTGNIFWGFFTSSTNSMMTTLVDNKGLIQKVKLPKQVFMVSRAYTALVNMGYSLIAYVLVVIFFRIPPNVYMLLIPIVIGFALLFSLGIGYLLSVLYVYFADIRYLYSVFTSLLMYLCCLFYNIDRLPDILKPWVMKNPIYVQIHIAREIVMHGEIPDIKWWLKLVLSGVLAFGVGLFVYKKNENKIIQSL